MNKIQAGKYMHSIKILVCSLEFELQLLGGLGIPTQSLSCTEHTQNFMKISSTALEFLHRHVQTDRHGKSNRCIFATFSFE